MENGDFADMVLGKIDREHHFEPQVLYDPDGDCIEFIASNEAFYAERINSLITVYIGRESHEIVGSLIKGVHVTVRDFLEQYPGFAIEIRDGKIRLEHFFTAKLWSSGTESEQAMEVYLKLRKVAEETRAEAEICELV